MYHINYFAEAKQSKDLSAPLFTAMLKGSDFGNHVTATGTAMLCLFANIQHERDPEYWKISKQEKDANPPSNEIGIGSNCGPRLLRATGTTRQANWLSIEISRDQFCDRSSGRPVHHDSRLDWGSKRHNLRNCCVGDEDIRIVDFRRCRWNGMGDTI